MVNQNKAKKNEIDDHDLSEQKMIVTLKQLKQQ
jgi:hypothetical protein